MPAIPMSVPAPAGTRTPARHVPARPTAGDSIRTAMGSWCWSRPTARARTTGAPAVPTPVQVPAVRR
ncbi:hypothetical protein ACLE50_01190 [Pseudonocardia sp. 1LY6.1]